MGYNKEKGLVLSLKTCQWGAVNSLGGSMLNRRYGDSNISTIIAITVVLKVLICVYKANVSYLFILFKTL